MKDFYQYDNKGNVTAIVTALSAPNSARQIESERGHYYKKVNKGKLIDEPEEIPPDSPP